MVLKRLIGERKQSSGSSPGRTEAVDLSSVPAGAEGSPGAYATAQE